MALIIGSYFRLYFRVIATEPQECWPLEEEEVVYKAPKSEEGMSEA